MGAIKDWAKHEDNLQEFDDAWGEYRKVCHNINSFDMNVIGNLHAQIAIMLSHKQMQLGLIETQLNAEKIKWDNKESYLLAVKYEDVAATLRKNIVKSDNELQQFTESLNQINNLFIVCKAEVNALQTAKETLSREMSRRLGK